MKNLNRITANAPQPKTERVLQFGGGNFLRAFIDWMFDEYNEKMDADLGVLLVATMPFDNYKEWQSQDNLYHVLTRGYQNGKVVDDKHLVKSISRILHLHERWDEYLESAENPDMRFIVSNTTEAGIRYSADDKATETPPTEFPAKLTLWLHRRYQFFKGARDKGCILIPVELILENGTNLKKCILQNADNWDLEEGFKTWIDESNTFCNTLVDRIVPGVRENLEQEWEKLGYKDVAITQGEAFHFFVIEAPQHVQEELPLNKAGLDVIFTDDQTPYRTRKVRILNGAHTSMVPVGYLYGIETVREAVEHEVMGKFINQTIFEEIIPTLDLPDPELQQFASDVLDRFKNPFIKHQLLSISLNSVSKFKTRVLPSLLEFKNRKGDLPKNLVLSLAAIIRFYKGELNGETTPLKDGAAVIEFFKKLWSSESDYSKISQAVLSNTDFWETDLTKVEGLPEMVAGYLKKIENEGMAAAVKSVL